MGSPGTRTPGAARGLPNAPGARPRSWAARRRRLAVQGGAAAVSHLRGGDWCAGVRGGAARWQQRGPLEGRQRRVGCGRRGRGRRRRRRGSGVGEGVLAGRVASGWARRGDGTTRPRCGDDGAAAVEASTGGDRQRGGQVTMARPRAGRRRQRGVRGRPNTRRATIYWRRVHEAKPHAHCAKIGVIL